jgi:outer membrane protein TolC
VKAALRRFVSAVVASVVFAGTALGAEHVSVPSISLETVLRHAAADPPSVKLAFATLGRYEAQRRYAQGGYLPSLTGQALGGVSLDNRQVYPNVPRIDSKSLVAQGTFTLDWTALNAARGPTIDAARAAEQAQRFATEIAKREAVSLAAELYVRASAASALVEDAELTVERRSSQYDAIADLVKAGIRPPVDAQRAQIELVSARFLVSARLEEELAAFAALAAAVGRSPSQPLRPEAGTPGLFEVSVPPELARQLAYRNRPEIRRLAAVIASRREEHSAALGSRLPTVGVVATGTASYLDILQGVGISGSQFGGSAGAYLRWAGLDPAVWLKAGIAEGATSEAERQLEVTLHAIALEAVEASYSVSRAKTDLDRASAILEIAQATREAQNGRYRSGVASLLELLDAENIEQQARQRRIEAERDHRVAGARLLSSCGLLVGEGYDAAMKQLSHT